MDLDAAAGTRRPVRAWRLRRPAVAVTVWTVLAGAVVMAGCDRPDQATGAANSTAKPGCPATIARVQGAVQRAERTDVPWRGPTGGPRAVTGKSIVYVAQTMANPGVAGVAAGLQEAARVIGWNVRVIDGQGTAGGISAAFSQAIAVRPAGIVLGGFDPGLTASRIADADRAGIPLIGWHAVRAPGPSRRPHLFTNITTEVADVARITADWIITRSNGNAGVVVFTDASIPFAAHKSDLITKELAGCGTVRLLSVESIPLASAGDQTPQRVSSLLSRFGADWTDSAAINDVYFSGAALALRAAGRPGAGPPFNIGAGDGDPAAFQRINSGQYQTATVPEPLLQQGWQIVDEFNRAFSAQPPSGYVAPVHISTAANTGGATHWDPQGYREAYRAIWGR